MTETPAPDGWEFRLSPDRRQFAIWEPGNEPWFAPEGNMPGRWISSADMDRLGWTRYTLAAVSPAVDRAAVPDTDPVRCPLCPDARILDTPADARAHFTTVHPEQRLVGSGPWPLLANREQPAPADRAALRDRIAATLDEAFQSFDPERTEDAQLSGHLADAVLAVLPAPADRAAVLAATADEVERVFTAEMDDARALSLHEALIVLRSKLPCTCARSQGLHEKSCRRYVAGHELLSPVRRLARAREELRRMAVEVTTVGTSHPAANGTGAPIAAPADRAAVLHEAADRLHEMWDAEREWLPATRLHEAEQEVRRMADETPQPEAWIPPPPGDTREQLPDHLLAGISSVLGKYYSTACHTATACQAAAYRHGDLADELRVEAERLHSRCRLNQKFTGQLCVCGCHPAAPAQPGKEA